MTSSHPRSALYDRLISHQPTLFIKEQSLNAYPVAALVMAPFIAKEGMEALWGKICYEGH